MNTRQYPRTLQQAFGPYTDHRIEEPREPLRLRDAAILAACALACIALIVMVIA